MRVKKFTTITSLAESAAKSVTTPTGRVFKGVTLIKAGLGNRRDKNYYPPEALQAGVEQGLFEGLRAFADHPDSVSEEIQPERSIRDMVGVYENASYDDSSRSVKADLRILRAHSWLSEAIDELIDVGHADKIGLSINGRGETEPTRRHLEEAGGEVEVNELKRFIELRSTDVVTEAGAGGGFAQLVESARRAKVQESGTMKPKMSAVLTQLREAVRKGDTAKAKELEAKLDAAENDMAEADEGAENGDGKKARKTQEMGAFRSKSRKQHYEADADDVEEAEDGDEVEEADDEAALDEAAEALRAADGPDGDDADESDDEDADDLDEADDEDDEADDEGVQESEEAARVPGRDKFVKHREAAITGGLGPKTGTVKSGAGRFTTKAGSKTSGKRMSTTSTMGFKKGRRPGGGRTREANVGAVLEQNRRLREQIARQDSINLATKLLRESSLPRAVRPHVLRDLIGLSKREMQAEINKQASILEAAASSAVERLNDDFDVVEGAGAATTLREGGFYGSRRSDGDDLGDILAECGLPMKRG